MDVNGTRFHLVLGKDDWLAAAGAPDGAEWNAQGGTMELERLPVVFPERRAETPPARADRRGAGRDRFGNWYWIGDDGLGIVARGHHDRAPQPFWPRPVAPCAPPARGDFAPAAPPPADAPVPLRGLAVTTDHHLVVGILEPAGLLVFDLAAGGPPVALRWPEGVPFAPWDIAAAPDGGAWVLDADNARLWRLDRAFRVRAAFGAAEAPPAPEFTPVSPSDGDDRSIFEIEGVALPITLDASLDVSPVLDPVSVESLCDGSALVLGRDPIGGPSIHRFTLDGIAGERRLFDVLADHESVRTELPVGHDLAFVAGEGCSDDTLNGTLYVVTPDGNQSFAFPLSGLASELEIGFDRLFYPMRRFGGRALVSAGGEAWYDAGGRWISLLEFPRPAYEREAVLRLPARGTGTDDERAFDGREPGCVWHRLFLDACIPLDSSIQVQSRAADTVAELAAAEWRDEPAPYLRSNGPELPFRRPPIEGDSGQAGTWELLFQAARGRYLQLRITLRGNGRVTPRLHGARVYYPRFSYLREYLPAVWREDPVSASFVDRLLANVEGTFTEVEGRIAAAQFLFDTSTVPPEFLEWLAGWLGASLDAAWSEEKRRFFLANALRMYAQRGTRDGLVRALRLALEDCVDPHLFDDCACGPGDGNRSGSNRSIGSGYGSTSIGSGSGGSTALARMDGSSSTRSTPFSAGCGCGGGGTSGGGGGGGGSRFSVRVVEKFLARTAPGVAWGDVGDLTGPGTTTTALAWTPAQGADPLHARWRGWLAERYGSVEALNAAWKTTHTSLEDRTIRLRATAPTSAPQRADWERFLREGLGFTYVPPSDADLSLWHAFLAGRYRQPEDLSRAWRRAGSAVVTSFESLPFPGALPAGGAELGDWITFVSVVVPMRRAAHRFTVLVPALPGEDPEAQRRRRDLAARIAEIEKPAHTLVSTRLYWAAFRVGEARLGTDTLLGRGSRFTALELGRGALAASHLAWTEPWNVRGRRVVGRDPASLRPQPRVTPAR